MLNTLCNGNISVFQYPPVHVEKLSIHVEDDIAFDKFTSGLECRVVSPVRTWSVESYGMDSSKPIFFLCLVNMEGSLDKEGTQACDKDACLVRKCFPQHLIGQCQNGEDGREDVRLDLILVMACLHFSIENLQMIS